MPIDACLILATNRLRDRMLPIRTFGPIRRCSGDDLTTQGDLHFRLHPGGLVAGRSASRAGGRHPGRRAGGLAGSACRTAAARGLPGAAAAQPRRFGARASGERRGSHYRSDHVAHAGSPDARDRVRLSPDADQGGHARPRQTGRHAALLGPRGAPGRLGHVPAAVRGTEPARDRQVDRCPLQRLRRPARPHSGSALLPVRRVGPLLRG